MSLINLKFNTNYNNIKNSSGDSAILYFSETWHMQLRRNKWNCLDNILALQLQCYKSKAGWIMMHVLSLEDFQAIAYISFSHNSIWEHGWRAGCSTFSRLIKQTSQYHLWKIRMYECNIGYAIANAFSFLNMKRSNFTIDSKRGRTKEGNARLLIGNLAVIPPPPPPFFFFSPPDRAFPPEPQLKLQNRSVWQLLNKMDSHKEEGKNPTGKEERKKIKEGVLKSRGWGEKKKEQ